MVQASESFLHTLIHGDIEAFMRDRASREQESGNARSYPSILQIPERAAESFKEALCDGNTSVLDAMLVQHPGIQHNFCYRQTGSTDYVYPILMAVETLQDVSVKWLLDNGVKPTNCAMCVLARVPCCDKKDAEKVRKIKKIYYMFVAKGVTVEDDYNVQPMYESFRCHNRVMVALLAKTEANLSLRSKARAIKPTLKPVMSSNVWAKRHKVVYQEPEKPLPGECFEWPKRKDLRDNPQSIWLQSCAPAEIKSLLADRILDPNVQDEDGNTLLHYALADTQEAASGYQKIFLLLSYGANRRLKNKEGKTAFEVSRLPINSKGNIVGDVCPSLRENIATQPIPIDEQEGHKLQYYHNVV